MENIYTYSIIIPHHNSPNFLVTLLESIPERDDVQIIIIDDNSDDDKKPIISRKNVEVFFIDSKNTRGAGHARNVGLEHVRGKWVLFADADDFYYNGFINDLDRYVMSDFEVIYYNYSLYDMVKCRDIQYCFNSNFKEYVDDIQWIKYIRVPWNKMIRKTFIEKYNLKFQECPNGNDAMFSYHVAALSTKVCVLHNPLYHHCINPNGITGKKRTYSQILSNLKNLYKKRYFLEYVNYSYSKPSLFRLIKNKLKNKKIKEAIVIFYIFVFNYKYIRRNKKEYVDIIRNFL